MRIGMFADMYKPHLSGVTNYVSLYKQRFEELGHEVFVFTYGNRDYADDEANVIRSPAVAWGSTGWQAGLGLSVQARDLMPTLDVAHVHHPFLSGRVALRQCGRRGIPVVFTNHTRYDLYSDAYARFVPRSVRYAFLRRYLSRFAASADLVLAPSAGIRQWLSDFGITAGAIEFSNAIDTAPFVSPPAPRARAELGFSEDCIVFCYLGRLGPEKNLECLVDAFVLAGASDPHAVLLLIGDGPGRARAQERLAAHRLTSRACFAGRTPYAEVPNLLAAADVFVTASVSEVHPLVVMEAMAAGLPVVGVRSPGVGDIVGSGATGFLTGNDAEEFASRMLELSRDVALRERMSVAAREAAGRYDIRILAEDLLGHYCRLIGQRQG